MYVCTYDAISNGGKLIGGVGVSWLLFFWQRKLSLGTGFIRGGDLSVSQWASSRTAGSLIGSLRWRQTCEWVVLGPSIGQGCPMR